jgi:hypothetical protein
LGASFNPERRLPNVTDQSYTPTTLSKAENMSRGMLYKLWSQGKGPRFYYIGNRRRISHEARLQRCGYIEIAQLYDSTNNGRLAMSVRRLAGLIPCNKDSPVLRELEDAGLIETVKLGRYTREGEERTASEYRLTDFRCDVTGEPPTRTYNPKNLWEPGERKPKRAKPLSSAERMRRLRKRKRCDERDAERPSEWDGSVPVSGTDCVTPFHEDKRQPRETGKNAASKMENVTLSVPVSHTLIHLTRGYAESEPPSQASPHARRRGETGENQGVKITAAFSTFHPSYL